MAIFAVIPKGDLALNLGDLVFLEGPAFVAQKIASRFKFFRGEWFMDRREGIPYYQTVLVKNPDLDVIRSLFRRVLLTTPGVTRVGRFTVAYDPAARHLDFDFEAFGISGEPIPVPPELRAFIVTAGIN